MVGQDMRASRYADPEALPAANAPPSAAALAMADLSQARHNSIVTAEAGRRNRQPAIDLRRLNAVRACNIEGNQAHADQTNNQDALQKWSIPLPLGDDGDNRDDIEDINGGQTHRMALRQALHGNNGHDLSRMASSGDARQTLNAGRIRAPRVASTTLTPGITAPAPSMFPVAHRSTESEKSFITRPTTLQPLTAKERAAIASASAEAGINSISSVPEVRGKETYDTIDKPNDASTRKRSHPSNTYNGPTQKRPNTTQSAAPSRGGQGGPTASKVRAPPQTDYHNAWNSGVLRENEVALPTGLCNPFAFPAKIVDSAATMKSVGAIRDTLNPALPKEHEQKSTTNGRTYPANQSALNQRENTIQPPSSIGTVGRARSQQPPQLATASSSHDSAIPITLAPVQQAAPTAAQPAAQWTKGTNPFSTTTDAQRRAYLGDNFFELPVQEKAVPRTTALTTSRRNPFGNTSTLDTAAGRDITVESTETDTSRADSNLLPPMAPVANSNSQTRSPVQTAETSNDDLADLEHSFRRLLVSQTKPIVVLEPPVSSPTSSVHSDLLQFTPPLSERSYADDENKVEANNTVDTDTSVAPSTRVAAAFLGTLPYNHAQAASRHATLSSEEAFWASQEKRIRSSNPYSNKSVASHTPSTNNAA